MKIALLRGVVLLLGTVGVCLTSSAQSNEFLSDYSNLKDLEGGYAKKAYISDRARETFGQKRRIMVDQPEVFIAPDTKYKGAKPDHLKTLSDTMRLAMMERLEAGGYRTADEPGEDVLFLRWAVTDLYLKKKKRSILSYTPVGFVVHSTAQAAVRDLWKKIDIVEMGVEMELLDSLSGEQLAAGIFETGQRKDKKKGIKQDTVTWEELDEAMRTFGERVRCQLDNAQKVVEDAENCRAIVIEPVYPDEEK